MGSGSSHNLVESGTTVRRPGRRAQPHHAHDEQIIEAVSVGNIQLVDARPDKSRDIPTASVPATSPGEPWMDPDFPTDKALLRCRLDNPEEIVWLRPKEFLGNPRMFGDKISRHDVIQGELANSWFLAALSGIADHQDSIRQQVLVDAELGLGFEGVVHVKLWQFQGWVDIYVDDQLPMRLVGEEYQHVLSSSPDPDVLWVTFISKAFAKLHGGFRNVSAKGDMDSKLVPILNAGYAFSCLSGGAHHLPIPTNKLEDTELTYLFSYIRNCIRGGNFCTSKVPDSGNRKRGLVPGAVYTIVDTCTVHGTNLFLVRSTWGSSTGTWIGAWSAGSSEINSLVPGTLEPAQAGESWICAKDFFKHFRGLRLCPLKPYYSSPFHQHLDLQLLLYGEWSEQQGSQVGRSIHYRFKNPKYQITVPETAGITKTPVIFEVVQHQQFDSDFSLVPLRMDIFKVNKRLPEHDVIVYTDMTEYRTYKMYQTTEYHYSLRPGEYILVPHTQNRAHAQFCIRVHASRPLECKYIGSLRNPMLKSYHSENSSNAPSHDKEELYFAGQWQSDVNAGGSMDYPSFFKNPQYLIDLQDFCRLRVTLLQQHEGPHYPMSFVVFKIDDATSLPLTFVNNEDMKTITKLPYIGLSYDSTTMMSLRPGRYVIIPHTRAAGLEKTYCLVIISDVSEIELDIQSYNTV